MVLEIKLCIFIIVRRNATDWEIGPRGHKEILGWTIVNWYLVVSLVAISCIIDSWDCILLVLQLTTKKVLYWELLITVQVHLSEFVWGIHVKGYWLSSNQKTAMRFNWPISIKDCWPGLQELVCPLLKINKLHNFNCNTNHCCGDTTEPWKFTSSGSAQI